MYIFSYANNMMGEGIRGLLQKNLLAVVYFIPLNHHHHHHHLKSSNLESYSTNSIVYIISVIYVTKIKHFTRSV